MLGWGGLQLPRVAWENPTEKMIWETELKEAWEGAC